MTRLSAAKPRKRVTAKRSALAESATMVDGGKVAAVMARAAESGLTANKGGRIAGRVSPVLIERAKAMTGLQSDTELIEFALANIAIEDKFAQEFRALRGTADPDLDLEF